MDILQMTAVELSNAIKEKKVTVMEALQTAINQIEKKEESLHSFVTIDKEGAIKQAREVQKAIDEGKLNGPLCGVPVAIKNNMCTKDLLTTCSSKILYNFIYYNNTWLSTIFE